MSSCPRPALTLAHELANGATVAHASTKAIVSHAVSHGMAATDEAMRELQKDFWKSDDLKVGLGLTAGQRSRRSTF